MIRKLKAKGFVEHPYRTDELAGEFNGRDVEVAVVTDNNKVYRIFLKQTHQKNFRLKFQKRYLDILLNL